MAQPDGGTPWFRRFLAWLVGGGFAGGSASPSDRSTWEIDTMEESQAAIAVLGAGCFWCVEAVYLDLDGVLSVKSGYAGGHTENPSYRQVCTGGTGHAEVVRIAYDPARLSYADLLRVFFTIHDPTTLNRQGADVGTQYRSSIMTGNEEEARIAHEVLAEIEAAGLYPGKIVTEIVPLKTFYPAEDEHDNYFARNPGSGYCQVVVAPKVRKFRKTFADRLKAQAA
jgi:peptide-methionine (S)-S-oxide reductase